MQDENQNSEKRKLPGIETIRGQFIKETYNVNIYAHDERSSKNMQQKLTELKGETNPQNYIKTSISFSSHENK